MDKASDFESEDCALDSSRGRSVSFFKHLGLMDKASDFESEDCAFESRRGRSFYFFKQDNL